MWCTNPRFNSDRTLYTSRPRVIPKTEKVQQYDCLDDESYRTLLKAHLSMGCLDEADKLSQEICTTGILSQQGDVQRAPAYARLRVRGCRRPPTAYDPVSCVGTARPRQSRSQQLSSSVVCRRG